MLSSGDGYTGGKTFFQDRVEELVTVVPDAESFNVRSPLTEPPEGLEAALRVFLLGVADANLKRVEENRSMMVQAHQNTGPHQIYRRWIEALIDDWQRGLAAGGAHGDEVRAGFMSAYVELSKTAKTLETFDDLMDNVPERAAELRIVEVNSTAQAEKVIKWKSAYYWLLIGGMKLDRGFTVEGLTVTYMPRPIAANADVLQQRARFFGYRGEYIDYCRVYLLGSAKSAFVGYIADEEFLRESLQAHEGHPLSAWKRDFILHRQFAQPTRVGVVGRRTARRRGRSDWIWPKSMHLGVDVRTANAALFATQKIRYDDDLADAATVFADAVDQRGAASPRNLAITGVPLKEALDFLLSVRLATREDSLLMTTVTMELARIVRQSVLPTASFVFMGGLEVPPGRGRQLDVVRQTIHVGMNPQGAVGRQVIYSGDDKFRSLEEVTIQLRNLRLSDSVPFDEYSKVPWLAISLPNGISRDFLLDLD